MGNKNSRRSQSFSEKEVTLMLDILNGVLCRRDLSGLVTRGEFRKLYSRFVRMSEGFQAAKEEKESVESVKERVAREWAAE